MEKLVVAWQRLLNEAGETCDRCNKTYLNLEKVISVLKPALLNFGIEIVFEKKALSLEEFKKDPLQSNIILIDGRPLEDLLNLKIGSSECCGPCGDSECRTILDNDGEKEEVEERLILKAIFKVLSEKI
ncbi:MAG: hypothetical protein OHK0040_14470 [bacterium]